MNSHPEKETTQSPAELLNLLANAMLQEVLKEPEGSPRRIELLIDAQSHFVLLAQECGDPKGQADATCNIAIIFQYLGMPENASREFQQALWLSPSVEHKESLRNLGALHSLGEATPEVTPEG